MSNTLVGMVTFGNVGFTKLAIESIRETVRNHSVDLIVVVGKPGDTATIQYLEGAKIPHIIHKENMGFPYSLNDIYDYAWKNNDYDYLILAGNDIVALPGTIDHMIELADTELYQVISALELDVRTLVGQYPEVRKYFSGDTYIFTDFSARPWEVIPNSPESFKILNFGMSDIQNLCLYHKSVFERAGYLDVNFFPAYFVDNDYANRLVAAKVKSCTISAKFFHFWSRTIHQGVGGSTSPQFENNKKYYTLKWGGEVGQETREASIRIATRDGEEEKIARWRRK